LATEGSGWFYNRGADEIVAVSVMLRRREGGRS
jgi:hypothetical protein